MVDINSLSNASNVNRQAPNPAPNEAENKTNTDGVSADPKAVNPDNSKTEQIPPPAPAEKTAPESNLLKPPEDQSGSQVDISV